MRTAKYNVIKNFRQRLNCNFLRAITLSISHQIPIFFDRKFCFYLLQVNLCLELVENNEIKNLRLRLNQKFLQAVIPSTSYQIMIFFHKKMFLFTVAVW